MEHLKSAVIRFWLAALKTPSRAACCTYSASTSCIVPNKIQCIALAGLAPAAALGCANNMHARVQPQFRRPPLLYNVPHPWQQQQRHQHRRHRVLLGTTWY